MQYAKPDELISLHEADLRGEQFEQILRDHNIQIQCGSQLEHGLLLLHEMRRRHENPDNKAPWRNLAIDIQEGLGVLHLIQLVLRNASNPEFSKIVPHLSELNRGEVAQTKSAPVTDQAANKIFELTVALAVMEHGTEIKVEHPLRTGKDRNPDVIARMSDGLRWGFACKVSHGDPSQTLFDLIVKGLDQIEKCTDADTGIVVLSLKNKIPHQELLPTLEIDESGMPVLGSHEDHQQVVERMRDFATERFKIMLDELHPDAIWEEVRDKTGLPGVLVHVMAGVGIRTQLGVVPTPIGFLKLVRFEFGPIVVPTRFTKQCKAMFEHVNHGLRVL